jgi:hypothetical protein
MAYGFSSTQININTPWDWMPIIYVIIGGAISLISSFLVQKMNQRHDLRKSTHEKMKMEQIEAYKKLLGLVYQLKIKIVYARNCQKLLKIIRKKIIENKPISEKLGAELQGFIPPTVRELIKEGGHGSKSFEELVPVINEGFLLEFNQFMHIYNEIL